MATTRTLPVLKVSKLHSAAIEPERIPAGLILKTTSNVLMDPQRTYSLQTGLSVEIPKGFHLKLFTVHPTIRLLESIVFDTAPLVIRVQNTSIHVEDVSPGDPIALAVLERSEDFNLEVSEAKPEEAKDK